jgi:hypothetical protein
MRILLIRLAFDSLKSSISLVDKALPNKGALKTLTLKGKVYMYDMSSEVRLTNEGFK